MLRKFSTRNFFPESVACLRVTAMPRAKHALQTVYLPETQFANTQTTRSPRCFAALPLEAGVFCGAHSHQVRREQLRHSAAKRALDLQRTRLH
eukprot:m.172470 g.172470  ORF g.172470 m.172470 type:complete len:93 (+) comp53268_c0_seq34:294-572(+)